METLKIVFVQYKKKMMTELNTPPNLFQIHITPPIYNSAMVVRTILNSNVFVFENNRDADASF